MRRRPYSVILLDEIEKAHSDIFNILLQVMEDGRLSDNLGHTVDFRNTVLIMTSNLAAKQISRDAHLGFQTGDGGSIPYEEMKTRVLSELKRYFRPEFLNRLDEVIVFHPLSKEDIKKIVELMLDEVKELLREKDINLKISDKAKTLIAQEGYDPDFGARPLRRAIQRLIENSLSEEILQGKFKEGDAILVNVQKEHMVFTKIREEAGAVAKKS